MRWWGTNAGGVKDLIGKWVQHMKLFNVVTNFGEMIHGVGTKEWQRSRMTASCTHFVKSLSLSNSWRRWRLLPPHRQDPGEDNSASSNARGKSCFLQGWDVNWPTKPQVGSLPASLRKTERKNERQTFLKSLVLPWEGRQYVHTRPFPVVPSP